MADPTTAVLVIGALSAAAAGAQTIQSNQAASASKRAQRRAAEVQEKQLREAADIERAKRQRESAQLSARLRLQSIESGVGSSSYEALFGQASTDLGTNLSILDRSLLNNIESVRTGSQARIEELNARIQNPLLSGFQGGLAGASTGLMLSGGYGGGGGGGSGSDNIGGSGGGPSFGGNRRTS